MPGAPAHHAPVTDLLPPPTLNELRGRSIVPGAVLHLANDQPLLVDLFRARFDPSAADQEAAEGRDGPGSNRLADRPGHGLGRALQHLQRHVPGEAVGHDHVGSRAGDVEALHVPHEVERARVELAGHVVVHF